MNKETMQPGMAYLDAPGIDSSHIAMPLHTYTSDLPDPDPAYWLASHPCPPWCHGRAHTSSDHPSDRVHDSAAHAVTFDTMEPSTGFGDYRAPEMTLQLNQGYRETEPRVCVEFEGDTIVYATLDEAEAIADALLALIAEARGGAL